MHCWRKYSFILSEVLLYVSVFQPKNLILEEGIFDSLWCQAQVYFAVTENDLWVVWKQWSKILLMVKSIKGAGQIVNLEIDQVV